jgi:hypothetical protein
MSLRKLMFTILAIAALAGTVSVVTINPVAAPGCPTGCIFHGG